MFSTKPAPGYDTGEGRQSEYNILFLVVSVELANYLNCYKTGHHVMPEKQHIALRLSILKTIPNNINDR